MIKPTVGRVVLYRPGRSFTGQYNGQLLAALITHVWSETCINIGGFDACGNPFAQTSVYLKQDDSPAPGDSYAEWMPYQKGQAEKSKELTALLVRVKQWRDCEGNEPFPPNLRAEIETALKP